MVRIKKKPSFAKSSPHALKALRARNALYSKAYRERKKFKKAKTKKERNEIGFEIRKTKKKLNKLNKKIGVYKPVLKKKRKKIITKKREIDKNITIWDGIRLIKELVKTKFYKIFVIDGTRIRGTNIPKIDMELLEMENKSLITGNYQVDVIKDIGEKEAEIRFVE